MDGGFFCQPRFILERHMFLEEKKKKEFDFRKFMSFQKRKKKLSFF
jgi:hypothetical protein